jgi:hypothetical protein
MLLNVWYRIMGYLNLIGVFCSWIIHTELQIHGICNTSRLMLSFKMSLKVLYIHTYSRQTVSLHMTTTNFLNTFIKNTCPCRIKNMLYSSLYVSVTGKARFWWTTKWHHMHVLVFHQWQELTSKVIALLTSINPYSSVNSELHTCMWSAESPHTPMS